MHLGPFGDAFTRPGPVLTACLDISRDNESGATEHGLRWRALRADLVEQGATEPALALVEERLTQPVHEPGGWGRLVSATGEAVLVDRVFPGRPRAEGAWGALPHLMPLLTVESAAVPYILVQTDRVGADITVSARSGSWSESIDGVEHQISKVNVGGWSHRRYHHGVENLWEKNAGDVAARIDRLVIETGAEVIGLAGDVRATQLVRDNIAERTRDLVHVLEGGGRSDGASDERLRAEMTSLTENVAARRAASVVEVFLEQRDRGGRATAGLVATIDALRRAQVETLLVPPGWDEHEPAWFGPDPTLLGLKLDELTALGVQNPEQAPVVDVVLRAAAGTDARLVVVPEHLLPLEGEPAVLLRFTDPSTPSPEEARS